MSDIDQNITILRSMVEATVDHRLSTSSDFAFLAGCIQGRLRQSVSVSTLERIWGYVKGYQSVRESTLSILAQFVGYPDWKTFVSDYCDVPSARSSHRVVADSLFSADVPVGGYMAIEWNPGRRVILCQLDFGLWRVENSIKSKLKAGDTFKCLRFTMNQPLYLEDYHHGDENWGLFVVGNRGGITHIELVNSIE